MDIFKLNWIYLILYLPTIISGFFLKHPTLDTTTTPRIENSNNSNKKGLNVIHFWNNYKRNLQSPSTINNRDIDTDHFDNFNELEALEMIPIIIERYRKGEISLSDEIHLGKLYGNLWSTMTEEASRNQNEEEMNPLLKALFNSFKLTQNSEISEMSTNDFEHNTVEKIHRKKGSGKKLFLNVNPNQDQPSQRILKVAAMLIHQVLNNPQGNDKSITKAVDDNDENDEKDDANDGRHHIIIKNRSRKIRHQTSRKVHKSSATINLQLKNIPIEQIKRSKRNVEIHLSASPETVTGKEANKIDALLEIFRPENRRLLEDDEYRDDNLDDSATRNTRHLSEELQYENEDNNDLDYIYDNFYDDDEDNEGVRRSVDSDYGSFQDLIFLAAKQKHRRVQEEMKLKN